MISNCHNKRCEYCGNIYDAKAPGTAEVKIFTYETDRSIADALSMNICPVCAERVKNLLIPTNDILVTTKYASNKELLERNSAILEHFDPLSGHKMFDCIQDSLDLDEPCGECEENSPFATDEHRLRPPAGCEPFEDCKDCEVKTDDTNMG